MTGPPYILPVILEQFLQLLPCKEYAAFDCTEWQVKPFGYFAVLESRNVHQKRNTVVPWQFVYDAVYLLAVIIVLGCILLELPWMIDVKKIVGVVDECLVTDLLAVVIYEDIAHDGVYPPFEICVGGILFHVVKRLE